MALGVLSALAVALVPVASPAGAVGSEPAIHFVVDVSGSMAGDKLASAVAAIKATAAAIPDSTALGLRSYSDSCDQSAVPALVPIGTGNDAAIDSAADGLVAGGGTPTTSALGRGLQELASYSTTGSKRLVLLTDGDTQCGVSICDYVKQNIPPAISITLYAVGLQVSDTAAADLTCAAEFTGGAYIPAESPEDLADALNNASGGSGGNPLDPTAWRAGDVHVHSAGDASLQDNLLCRQAHLIPDSGPADAAQKSACATFLVGQVSAQAKAHGLDWVILAEHGPWLGIDAPGNDPHQLTTYAEAEARGEWRTIRDVASAKSSADQVRMLMGEEIGTAPPVTTSGHFSAYYTPDYVTDDQFLREEGDFLSRLEAAGGWGAINHPGTGSTWGCWTQEDDQRARPVGGGITCPGGVASQFPDTVRALEVYTGAGQPIRNVLNRWDGLLVRGLAVAAVGGGDTHTASRIGIDVPDALKKLVTGHLPRLDKTARQETGNISALGSDGRARTYVLGARSAISSGYRSDSAADPVRTAIKQGRTLASDGPVVGLTLDGVGPNADRLVPWNNGSHTLKLRWDTHSSYGSPAQVRLVVGQRVDPDIKGDCGLPSIPYRLLDCEKTIKVPLVKPTTVGSQREVSFDLRPSDFTTFSLPRPGNQTLRYTPATFVRVEVDFAGKRGVYSSPFYLQGNSLLIPNF